MAKRADEGPPFVVLVDKPAGPTSHDLVRFVRRVTGRRRAGHCGTLDPFATGLLVVCVGGATRLADRFTASDKRYRVHISLGRATDTLDCTGTTTAELAPNPEQLERAPLVLREMIGELELRPPDYSAAWIDGERAHRIARSGRPVAVEPRTMRLLEVEDARVDGLVLEAELAVEKGTYVRSLAAELGRRLDLPVHVAALRRLAAGRFRVDDPACLRGFSCRPRSGATKPRFDIDLEEAEVRVQAGALTLERAVGLPGHVIDDPGHPLLARLQAGQRLSAGDPEAQSLIGRTLAEGDAAFLASRGLFVVLRCEAGPRGLRLAPERVIAWSA